MKIKKQKKSAQLIKKAIHDSIGQKKVSTVETLQRILMPPTLTQFINTLLAKVPTVKTDFQRSMMILYTCINLNHPLHISNLIDGKRKCICNNNCICYFKHF